MSVYSALTALTSQQTKLDVIGNNLANVSTIGYKSQSVTFADLLSQTISGASAASASSNIGGTNSKQIGLGVSVAAISTDITTGSSTYTGVATDVSIDGSGYFIVEGETAGTYYFTRNGSFSVDENGNLTVNGYKVCGWEPDSSGSLDTETEVSGINLFYNQNGTSKQIIAPEETSKATMTGTLDASADMQGDSIVDIGLATTEATLSGTVGTSASQTITVYSDSGDTTTATVKFTKGTAASYTYTNASGVSVTETLTPVTYVIAGESTATGTTTGTLYFDADGNILSDGLTIGTDTMDSTVTATVDGVSVNFDFSNLETSTTSSLSVKSDGGVDADSSAKMSVYDALGNEYDVTVSYTNCYTSSVYDASGNQVSITTVYWDASDSSDNIDATGSGYMAFDAKGNLLTGKYYSDAAGTTLVYDFANTYDIGISANTDSSGNKLVNIDDFTVEMDVSALTLYGDGGTVAVGSSDGYASGTLTSYSISSDGTITGVYSNNQTQVLAQLGLAVFDNAAGLDKIGSSVYAVSANSGEYTGAVVAGSDGSGSLSSGTLEASNVDLSEQFADMMVAERAYQAASKLITVTDDMMQTVINMVS